LRALSILSRPTRETPLRLRIGPAHPKKLGHAFGEKVFNTTEAEPSRLRGRWLRPVRGKRYADAWAEQKVVGKSILHSNGIGTTRAVRIYETQRVDGMQATAKNPYRVTRDVCDIGFKTADSIAMRFGIDKKR
jgi:exodeoxyribonuclease V alpha subunit